LENIPPEIQSVLDGKVNAVKLSRNINPFKEYFHHKNMWFIGHHYAHSLSTWMLCDKIPNVSVVIDGIGDDRVWSVFKNDNLIAMGNPEGGSFGGLMWGAGKWINITASNGNDIAGKVMGIQSYGNLNEGYLKYLQRFTYRQVLDVFCKDYWYEYKMDFLLGDLCRLDWVRTVHERCGQLIVDIFSDYADSSDIISYSGGVAQNVVWNTEIRKKFPNVIIPPHSGDEGLSLGAIEWLRKKNNLPKFKWDNFPYNQFDHAPSTIPSEEIIKTAAQFLSEGKIISWYQGNGEIGPRSLGNRCILMDPRIPNGKFLINKIKNRENYRPFGASILEEYALDYFDMQDNDPYMLYVANLKVSGLDSIKHIDNTCRVQTVSKNQNIFYRKLLEEFFKLTTCPILLNTSLNISGLPLAGYPEISLDMLNITSLDAAFIGNEYIYKDI
jgi:carbamoyltransferase